MEKFFFFTCFARFYRVHNIWKGTQKERRRNERSFWKIGTRKERNPFFSKERGRNDCLEKKELPIPWVLRMCPCNSQKSGEWLCTEMILTIQQSLSWTFRMHHCALEYIWRRVTKIICPNNKAINGWYESIVGQNWSKSVRTGQNWSKLTKTALFTTVATLDINPTIFLLIQKMSAVFNPFYACLVGPQSKKLHSGHLMRTQKLFPKNFLYWSKTLLHTKNLPPSYLGRTFPTTLFSKKLHNWPIKV